MRSGKEGVDHAATRAFALENMVVGAGWGLNDPHEPSPLPVFPSTAKTSMASYEFVLVHCETGRHAGVQVKSGNVGFLDQQVAQDFDDFFVFMTNATAVLAGADLRIKRIGRDEIEAFARRYWTLLPRRLQARWPIV